MIYLSTKSNLEFMQEFTQMFKELRRIEKIAHDNLRAKDTKWLTHTAMFQGVREEAYHHNENYTIIRANYTKMIPRASQITEEQRVSHHRKIRSAPIEGGNLFSGSIYKAILDPPSSLIDLDVDFHDTVNQVLGSLEWRKVKELRQVRNPLYWLKEFIVFVIRLPFTLIRISGFDIKIVEEHFLGKLFQLLYVMALILLATKFGISLADMVKCW